MGERARVAVDSIGRRKGAVLVYRGLSHHCPVQRDGQQSRLDEESANRKITKRHVCVGGRGEERRKSNITV